MIRHKLLIISIISVTVTAVAQTQESKGIPSGSKCDSSCLTAAMNDYLSKMLARDSSAIKIRPNATIYVNTHLSKLEENPLLHAKQIKSKQIFTDPITSNVVARTGLEMDDGKIAYASTRLKIVDGAITQVEVSFDSSNRVVASYVTFLDPLMTTIVPPEERQSRAELEAIIERYFQSLTDHIGVPGDYDDRCDRYHSGQRVTNNSRNTVEGAPPMPSTGSPPTDGPTSPKGPMPAMTCFTSINGPRPWGPATNIRIPVVDPEHGIVIGYTLLLYKGDSAPMYVSEVFKILDGKIRMIDNMGLKAEGMQEVHFSQ